MSICVPIAILLRLSVNSPWVDPVMGDCGDDMLERVCGGKTSGRGKLVIGVNCAGGMYILLL